MHEGCERRQRRGTSAGQTGVHASSVSISTSHAFSIRLSLRAGTFYRIRNSTVRVQPIIWFIPKKRVCMCVCAVTVKGKRDVERRSGGDSLRCVLSGWNLFLSSSPRLISFSSLFLPSCAHLLSLPLSSFSLHLLFIISRALSS